MLFIYFWCYLFIYSAIYFTKVDFKSILENSKIRILIDLKMLDSHNFTNKLVMDNNYDSFLTESKIDCLN